MLPKLQKLHLMAIENGVSRVHILDGRSRIACCVRDLYEQGIGTAILNDEEERFYSGE